jgi:hypothetical protein
LPVLQTFRGKEPFSRKAGYEKERVDCPWAGRRHWVMGLASPDGPALDERTSFIFVPKPIPKPIKSKSTVRPSPRLDSSFLDNPAGILDGFIGLEHLFQSFDLGHPVQAEFLEVPPLASSPTRACSHRAATFLVVLPHLLVVGYDAVYSPIENHHRWR